MTLFSKESVKVFSVEELLRLDTAAAEIEKRREMRCHAGIADAFKLAGLVPPDLPIPDGERDAARWSNRSLWREWLEGAGRQYFLEATPPLQCGDLLVFRLGHVPHHGGIMLSGGRMLHVFGEHGLRIAPCLPTAWARRLDSVWRLRK